MITKNEYNTTPTTTLRVTMLLYFLDDGSLLIDDEEELGRCLTLIKSDDFNIERVVGQNYLSGLSGQDALDFIYNQLNENGISSSTKSDGTGNQETK